MAADQLEIIIIIIILHQRRITQALSGWVETLNIYFLFFFLVLPLILFFSQYLLPLIVCIPILDVLHRPFPDLETDQSSIRINLRRRWWWSCHCLAPQGICPWRCRRDGGRWGKWWIVFHRWRRQLKIHRWRGEIEMVDGRNVDGCINSMIVVVIHPYWPPIGIIKSTKSVIILSHRSSLHTFANDTKVLFIDRTHSSGVGEDLGQLFRGQVTVGRVFGQAQVFAYQYGLAGLAFNRCLLVATQNLVDRRRPLALLSGKRSR